MCALSYRGMVDTIYFETCTGCSTFVPLLKLEGGLFEAEEEGTLICFEGYSEGLAGVVIVRILYCFCPDCATGFMPAE